MTKRAGVVGGVLGGATAAAAAAAVVVERRAAAARHRRRGVPEAPFPPQPYDRQGTVVADDGTGLHYEEVGAADAPLTDVFVKGYTLNMSTFYLQLHGLLIQYRVS